MGGAATTGTVNTACVSHNLVGNASFATERRTAHRSHGRMKRMLSPLVYGTNVRRRCCQKHRQIQWLRRSAKHLAMNLAAAPRIVKCAEKVRTFVPGTKMNPAPQNGQVSARPVLAIFFRLTHAPIGGTARARNFNPPTPVFLLF